MLMIWGRLLLTCSWDYKEPRWLSPILTTPHTGLSRIRLRAVVQPVKGDQISDCTGCHCEATKRTCPPRHGDCLMPCVIMPEVSSDVDLHAFLEVADCLTRDEKQWERDTPIRWWNLFHSWRKISVKKCLRRQLHRMLFYFPSIHFMRSSITTLGHSSPLASTWK